MRKSIKKLTLLLFVLLTTCLKAQNTRFLEKLIKNEPAFKNIVAQSDHYQVQILYTQINRNSKNKPKFKDYSYNLSRSAYFYPGNTVNLPAAALVLEKINNLANPEVDKRRYVKIDTAFAGQTQVTIDPLSDSGLPSFENYILRIFLLQDIDAFNRSYEFLGQKYFNERIHQLGYPHTWILHRLGEVDNNESARHTNPITFYRNDKTAFYRDIIYLKIWPTTLPFTSVHFQEAAYNPVDYYSGRTKRFEGKAHLLDKKTLVQEPFDFTNKNEFPLEDMHNFLRKIIFPDQNKHKLNLTQSDYAFIYKALGQQADEIPPKFSSIFKRNIKESNCFFSDNMLKNMYPSMRIFSNSGKGYGYLLESAYIVDFKNNVEFMLSIVINCNESGIIGNEQNYRYDEIGKPFMQTIAKLLYDHELKRKKKHLPNLEQFQVF